MGQMDLFQVIDLPTKALAMVPKAPPRIASAGVREVELDFETNGLRWWEKDRPVGVGVCLPDMSTDYIAWGHRGGGNTVTEDAARRWMRDELRGVRITNLNMKFEVHMAREFGVDFEGMGCEVSDVGHYAALLDEQRKEFSLKSLVRDFLTDETKVERVGDITLDARRMAEYPANVVAVRAEGDVRQVHKLKKLFWPQLDAQDLQRVRALEDQVIFVCAEMEKNGAIINHEELGLWLVEIERAYKRVVTELFKLSGLKINPRSSKDRLKLFNHFNLPISYTDGGNASFTDQIVKAQDHPAVKLMRRATKLASIRSKLRTYEECVDSHGILRYSLHQLRAVKDDHAESGESGTISGRFSSTEIVDGVGVNIQQVIKSAKQRVAFGYDEKDSSHDDEIFIVRKLHIPGSGLFLSADAMQIEYRLFADKTKSPRLIDAYADDMRKLAAGEEPLSFHKFMHETLRPFAPNLTYRRQKDLNFAKIYGAGIKKMALMLEFITQAQYEQLNAERATRKHPLLQETAAIDEIYNQQIPEVKPLLRRAAHLAKTECDDDCIGRWGPDELHRNKVPHRGYVRTILGRRTRFPGNRRLHKALNAVIQGSAADIMKQKLVELHKARDYTGFLLRYTVHDEVDGDVPDKEAAKRVSEVLNAQSFPQIKVPVLWDVSTGANWRDCA